MLEVPSLMSLRSTKRPDLAAFPTGHRSNGSNHGMAGCGASHSRTRLHHQLPDNREKNRELVSNCPLKPLEAQATPIFAGFPARVPQPQNRELKSRIRGSVRQKQGRLEYEP